MLFFFFFFFLHEISQGRETFLDDFVLKKKKGKSTTKGTGFLGAKGRRHWSELCKHGRYVMPKKKEKARQT